MAQMRTALTRSSVLGLWLALVLPSQVMLASAVLAQETKGKFQGDSNADPPVTQDDVRIVQRAKAILSSPAKWNRADNRECPKTAKTFSLYCALETASDEVSGHFEHREAAMQQARFVIDDDLAKGNHYDHRLMDYNNDPRTTFADTQEFFRLLEERIATRLSRQQKESSSKP
jgi:hypothetical protein